jgi:hypothetical protein
MSSILHRETEDRGFCRKGREIHEEICQEKSSQTENKEEEEERVINEEICKCKKHQSRGYQKSENKISEPQGASLTSLSSKKT